MKQLMIRWARCVFPCLPVLLAVPSSAAVSPERAVLNRYCVGCHNSKSKTGGLALDTLSLENAADHAEKWEKVVRKLDARFMPPAGVPRPDEHTYNQLVSAIASSLDRAAEARPDPGRTETFRRLNRAEYHNAVRDLLAIDVDISALLPGDESSHGFDNVTAGDLSPTLLERYLDAARKISRKAVGRPLRSPGGDTIQLPPDLTQEERFEELPFGTRGGAVVDYTFPLDAEYEFQLRLQRDRNEHVEGLTGAHQIELTLDGARIHLFTIQPPLKGADHHAVDLGLHIRIPVNAGPHQVGVAFPKKRSALLETERQPYQAHFNMDRHPRIQPALYSITINGPYQATGSGETPSRQRIFLCRPANSSEEFPCAKRILSALMRRAYRRPVTDAALQLPLRLFQQAAKNGGFEAGIEMGLRSILVSPEFLFRVEQDPPGIAPHTAYRVSDLELASRLSFFLWSSIPDGELLDAAIHGRLKDPAALERQARRMLADPRSKALVDNFADQWLYLRNLDSMTPDMRLFPDFDDNLRQAFHKETQLFFESIMREDRNVLDLLRAGYSFVNGRLAKHYGIPNIYGPRFRRVNFDKDSVRGGLLRQGSVLTVTSYATRTSPVIRGKWVLANLIGIPPPPPPPVVPALTEEHGISNTRTMRRRLAAHRANPVCAACHQLMDPIGFAMENYDAIGRFRAKDGNSPIDAAGNLPGGHAFTGVAGLEQALLNHPRPFFTTFTEKLLTYALGRGTDYHDAPAIRGIIARAAPRDYRFSEFLIGVVNSAPFQMRRSQ